MTQPVAFSCYRASRGLLVAGLVLVAFVSTAHCAEASGPEANRTLVLEFYAQLDRAEAAGQLRARVSEIAAKYIAPDYIQHSEMFARFGSGREGFIRALEQAPAMPPDPASKPATVVTVMAEGDRVMLLTSRDVVSPDGHKRPIYIFNMFRIHDGQLAEHWDIMPAGLAPPAGMGAPGKQGNPASTARPTP